MTNRSNPALACPKGRLSVVAEAARRARWLVLAAALQGCCNGEYSAFRPVQDGSFTARPPIAARAVYYTPREARVVERVGGAWVGSIIVSIDAPATCRGKSGFSPLTEQRLHAKAIEIAAQHGGTHVRMVDERRAVCGYGHHGTCALKVPTAQYYVLRVERERWHDLPARLVPR